MDGDAAAPKRLRYGCPYDTRLSPVVTAERPSLRDAWRTPEHKHAYVRRLFATIADRYDLITVLLSYGQDRRWKHRLATLVPDPAGARALDLACGTGDIAYELAARGARVTALDITPRMLALARRRPESSTRRVGLVAGDMMALPFADGCFDVISTGYGLRNVPILQEAVHEIARVLRPGGLMLSLDFNRPRHALVRTVYLWYLSITGAALGWILHRDPDTYRYIPESIRHYPGAEAVCEIARAAGLSSCTYIPVLGGLLAIHVGRK
jgi:demethylmenaquinone methyltransferase/2-methoxy-6-polyprenyl-1,4-benzoquinol methylase